MSYDLLIVSGAPGSGKSTTVRALLDQDSRFVVLDIDWLADAASELAGRSIYSDPSTWPAYNRLWSQVLNAIARSGNQPIFFCPNTPNDLEALERADWCRSVSWLLLDCSDEVRTKRLEARSDWTEARKTESLADAAELRGLIDRSIDTGVFGPGEVAVKIIRWAEAILGDR